MSIATGRPLDVSFGCTACIPDALGFLRASSCMPCRSAAVKYAHDFRHSDETTTTELAFRCLAQPTSHPWCAPPSCHLDFLLVSRCTFKPVYSCINRPSCRAILNGGDAVLFKDNGLPEPLLEISDLFPSSPYQFELMSVSGEVPHLNFRSGCIKLNCCNYLDDPGVSVWRDYKVRTTSFMSVEFIKRNRSITNSTSLSVSCCC